MLNDNTYDDGTDLDDDTYDGPLYPDIKVQLTGVDGNAFGILGRCLKTCKRADISADEVAKFTKEATSGDYSHLLATCVKWFECS
jgi:hypothetical protein